MDAERQRHARRIAEAASRLAPSARAQLIKDACGHDAEMSSQVEDILADLDEPHTVAPVSEGETSATAAPRTWGPLTLLEEIGRGHFGRVFRAWDPTLAREVALKLIQVGSEDSSVIASLLREGRLLARLQHPNIVTVFGAQHIGTEVGLWMEFVRGVTLTDLVAQNGPLGPTEAAVIGAKLCSALSAVHQAGLVHRDVKPRNVMRAERGRIVLMDFGAGREIVVAGSRERFEIIGTPAYMAYEVLQGEPATPSSDIYSLGVLLFFLVSGAHPVAGRSFGAVRDALHRGERRLLADLRSDLPDSFVLAVERACALDPRARYTSAAAFRQDLARIAALEDESGSGSSPPQGPGGRSYPAERSGSAVGGTVPSSVSRILGATALGLLLVLAAVGTTGFLASRAFDLAYGRVGGFARESPAIWLRVGAQALVAPVVAGLIGSVLLVAATAFCRTMTRVSGYCRRLAGRLGNVTQVVTMRTGLDEPLVLAAGICLAALVAVGVIWWRFSELLALIRGPLSESPEAELSLLAPPDVDEFGERALYRFLLEFLLFGLLVAWVRLLSHCRSRPETSLAVRVAPLPVIALVLFMLVVPYRVLYPGEFELATFDDAACYVVAEQLDEVLLFCPLVAPPRTRTVANDDERLVRTGVWERPFDRDLRAGT